MTREVVIDVETTGLFYSGDDRIIEVACIELDRYRPTGRLFHRYCYPQMERMPLGAYEVHGIGIDFLRRHPPFIALIDDLISFIGPDRVIAHNIHFDIGFINAELARANRPPLGSPTFDTLGFARHLFPGASNSLDALCKRFGIDLSVRKRHGALVDCRLLSEVYFQLLGGAQPLLSIPKPIDKTPDRGPLVFRPPRAHAPTAAEDAAHLAMLAFIERPLWLSAREEVT